MCLKDHFVIYPIQLILYPMVGWTIEGTDFWGWGSEAITIFCIRWGRQIEAYRLHKIWLKLFNILSPHLAQKSVITLLHVSVSLNHYPSCIICILKLTTNRYFERHLMTISPKNLNYLSVYIIFTQLLECVTHWFLTYISWIYIFGHWAKDLSRFCS